MLNAKIHRLLTLAALTMAGAILTGCSKPESTATAEAPGAASGTASGVADYIQAAVSDPARPETDTSRDSYRLPGESVAFSGMKAGDKVADLLPGRGYFTRIFSKVVGPTGHVYAAQGNRRPRPQGAADGMGPMPQGAEGMGAAPGGEGMGPPAGFTPPNLDAIAAEATYGGNITVSTQELVALSFPEPLDLVWTSLNYHDLANPARGMDMAAINKSVFNALKPGGVYMVIDHAAAAGAGLSVADTLHRIEGATVRTQVEAAGFVFEAESGILKNPLDTYDKRLDGESIPTQSDKFVYRFRKPAAG